METEVTRPKQPKWGFSSAGRAPALHAGGQEFESPNLHHLKPRAERLFFSAFMFFTPKSRLCSKFITFLLIKKNYVIIKKRRF